VQRKLSLIGVADVSELLKRVHDGSINDSLEKAGERRFNLVTLESMRSVGSRMTSAWLESSECLLEESSSEGENGHTPCGNLAGNSDFLDPSFFFDDEKASGGQSRCELRSPKSSLGRWTPSRKLEPYDEEVALLHEQASLRRQICRGLSQMEAVSAEARRRNFEVTRCLAEVQADITRITDRMCAARQRQAAKYHDTSQEQTIGNASVYSRTPLGKARRPSSLPSDGLFPPTWPRRPGSESRRKQSREVRGDQNSDSMGRRQCDADGKSGFAFGFASRAPKEATSTRGKQSGFRFGGNAPTRAPQLKGRRTASDPANTSDPTSRAQEVVRQQLLTMLDRSEPEKRAFVKRLLVKWHPDRNPESVEVATAIFQYIQQEKQHLMGL